jgi:8-oxo-dGTP diphosphatase
MDFKKKIEKVSEHYWEIYVPNLSLDCVVFGFHDNLLKVLVIKMIEGDLWALPGGYILKTEQLNDAATRILKERTGAEDIYLQQFRVFGNLNRSESFFEDFSNNLWHKQRFVSVGFYALVDFTKVNLVIDEFSIKCEWKSIDELPELMMDHSFIFEKALSTLRKQLIHKPIGYNLLPKKFTMPELQKLYATL